MSQDAERLNAALADRYRVQRELGAGGMATVYLAADLRHDRDVAIKVLHPELAAALGGERFLSEIKTTARLQHPHILPLLDSGTADGLLFYVMPYVSGETLRDRLDRDRQLPVDEALRLTREIADALGHAHAQGIVHRDIKPENILLQGGHALVADFGIALAVSAAGGQRMTQTGLSLGTPQYMSPEQAMGEKGIDARSDIYALGAVTYEMLVGEPPFTGTSVQAIVGRLLTEAPRPLTAQRHTIPLNVETAVLRALEKLPADRYETAAEFIAAMGDERIGTRALSSSVPAAKPRAGRERVLAAALGVAVVAAGLGWMRSTPTLAPSRQQVVLWKHQLPDALTPGAPMIARQVALAPDGSSIVYTDSTPGGFVLMRKPRNEPMAEPMAGTEGGLAPFFSPDGQWIGFLTMDGRLRKIPVTGGGVITLATDAHVDYKIATWADDNRIYYVTMGNRVSRVDTDNPQATSEEVFQIGSEAIIGMSALPDTRGLLLSMCPGNCAVESSVRVLDFKSDSLRRLVPAAYGALYAPTGHLLYTGRDGGLYATGFDLGRMETTSGAVPVIPNVVPASFTLSPSGDAVYSVDARGRVGSELMWVDRTGTATPFDSTWRAPFEYPALSPDGRTLAVSIRGEPTELWLYRPNGARQKVVAPGSANWRPNWTADGSAMFYSSVGSANGNDVTVWKVPADLGSEPVLVQRHSFGIWEVEVSRDGQWMVVRADEDGSVSNLRYRAMSGDTALKPLLVDQMQTTTVALSPNGRWLAYTSTDGSGERYDTYIAPFPGMTPQRLVSRGGGVEPRWSSDGRELYFKSNGMMQVVSVTDGPTLVVGDPRPLFSLAGYRGARNRQQYDVAPDGRFLMIRDPRSNEVAPVVYAAGWLESLREMLKR